jgi:hypothetical protein
MLSTVLVAADPIVAPVVTSATSGFTAEYTAIIPVAIAIAAVPFLAKKIWRFAKSLIS